MHETAKLLLVGCGKMGGALLGRALGPAVAGAAATAVVVDPAAQPERLKSLPSITWLSSPDKIDPAYAPDIILLAIKPQQIAAAVPNYAHIKSGVFLSIAAGVTIARLQALLKDTERPVVRAMPNLPACIGKGVSVAVAGKNVSAAQRKLCNDLLGLLGKMAWVENEALLDAVTALSGSGPAYVFALCEAMASAGEALGLSAEMAAMLARQTAIGSGALLDELTDSAESLRKAVTSPGGTTEAALKYLLGDKGLCAITTEAMTAAAARAKELAAADA